MARAALANATQQLGELVGRPASDAVKPDQEVEHTDKASAQDAGRAAVSSSPNDGAPRPAASKSQPQETRLMRAVRIAAADAVPRQAGLAPLMADLRAVVDRPETPPEVRVAGETLLARLPQGVEMTTPQGLRRALEHSGVFLEARLAKGGLPNQEGGVQSGPADTDLKAALLVFKSALGNWLARAMPSALDEAGLPKASADRAPMEAGEAEQPTATPAARAIVRSEADRLGGEPNGSSVQTSGPPRDVFGRTGGLTPSPTPVGEPPTLTPETGGRAITAEQGGAPPPTSDDEIVEPRFAAFLAQSRPVAAPQRTTTEATKLGLLGLAEASTVDDKPSSAVSIPNAALATRGYRAAQADTAGPKTPPPPFADGPMGGQRPMTSNLPPYAPAGEIVRRLLKGASAALARQDLMQIASLREAHYDPETGETRLLPARLNLDVPFVTPQGVAVAQFEITKDGGGAGGGATVTSERTYRVRFSIDIEPLGPVHALVSLTGVRARVSLWAERAETIARLRAGEESLGAALRQAELTPEVAVHSGAPPVRDAGALGHFVDQAS